MVQLGILSGGSCQGEEGEKGVWKGLEERGAEEELGAVLWRQLAGWHVSSVLMMFSLLVSVARGDIEVHGKSLRCVSLRWRCVRGWT